MDVEKKMEEYLAPLFGDMASMTIKMQKDKLDLGVEPNKDDYRKVIESIHALCESMAGGPLADKIKKGLLEILEKEFNNG